MGRNSLSPHNNTHMQYFHSCLLTAASLCQMLVLGFQACASAFISSSDRCMGVPTYIEVDTIGADPGKSECSRCKSANGRFCRACLLVRYGLQLEAVRQQMAAGTWLCPHCYEDDHPKEVC